MEDNPIWICLEVTNDAAELLKQALKYSSLSTHTLQQISSTLDKTRDCLTHFLHARPNDNAFDVCFNNIKTTVQEMKDEINLITASSSVFSFSLLRNDFLLCYRVDQLVLLFPKEKDAFSGAELIKDSVARSLWRNSFGDKTNMVPWKNFYDTLKKFLSLSSDVDPLKVANFIDFTRIGFVTPYEFDLFVRWFGPLASSVTNLLKLLDDGILAGFISAEETEMQLNGREAGTFLCRFSKSQITSFALACVTKEGKLRHYLISTNSPHGIKVGSKRYSTLFEFIDLNRDKFIESANYCWMGAIEDKNNSKEVVEESNTIFKPQETSAERETPICVICMDRPQETIFLECGHMCCCRKCAKRLMGECPVCREPIIRIVNVFQA